MYIQWFVEPELTEEFAGYNLYLLDSEREVARVIPCRTKDDALEIVAEMQVNGELVI